MTTSSAPGEGSGSSATRIRGCRQTWLPRRAIRAAASALPIAARLPGRGSQSASSSRPFTTGLPVVRFELDELDRVAEGIEGKEAGPAGDLAVVVPCRHAGLAEVLPEPHDVVDLEAGMAPRLRVDGDAAGIREHVQLLVADVVPEDRSGQGRWVLLLFEPEDLAEEPSCLLNRLGGPRERQAHVLETLDPRPADAHRSTSIARSTSASRVRSSASSEDSGGRRSPPTRPTRSIAALIAATLFAPSYAARRSSMGRSSSTRAVARATSPARSASNTASERSGRTFATPDVNPTAPRSWKGTAHVSARPQTHASSGAASTSRSNRSTSATPIFTPTTLSIRDTSRAPSADSWEPRT